MITKEELEKLGCKISTGTTFVSITFVSIQEPSLGEFDYILLPENMSYENAVNILLMRFDKEVFEKWKEYHFNHLELTF